MNYITNRRWWSIFLAYELHTSSSLHASNTLETLRNYLHSRQRSSKSVVVNSLYIWLGRQRNLAGKFRAKLCYGHAFNPRQLQLPLSNFVLFKDWAYRPACNVILQTVTVVLLRRFSDKGYNRVLSRLRCTFICVKVLIRARAWTTNVILSWFGVFH